MSSQTTILVSLLFIILVPIVPAYLLFSILPSRADVKGPLQGLEIKLSGAFAGYFLLVLVIIAELPRIRGVFEPETAQVWRVEGHLYDEHGNGLPVAPCDVQFKPPAYEQDANGWFRATFTTSLSPNAALPEFPNLWVGHSGFPNEIISLAPSDATSAIAARRDETAHYILLKPIVLRRPTALYAPAGAAPQPGDQDSYARALQSLNGARQ